VNEEPLELSETFRHFNSLMWQIPTWSVGIAVAVIVAADQIRADASSPWGAWATEVRVLILLFGCFLLSVLVAVLHRWRAFQAASTPAQLPIPPFKQRPPAESLLQGVSCVTAGGLGGFAITHLLASPWPLVGGFALGLFAWWWLNRVHAAVVEKINRLRES